MGSGQSRPPSPGPKSSPPAGAKLPPPEPASPCDGQEAPFPNPLTPPETRSRVYGLPTPPPSGNPRQGDPPEKQEPAPAAFTPATPPTTPAYPPSPTPSQTLLGTSTPTTSFSSSSTLVRPREREPQSILSSTEDLCSGCHRPVSRSLSKHGKEAYQLSPLSSPSTRPRLPSPLPCGHRLCRRCTRASLLTSLSSSSSSSFTPATCPATNPASDLVYPPPSGGRRCRAAIPLAVLGEAATAAEFLAYRAALRERRTPAADRLYCHCGVFLLSRPAPSGAESQPESQSGSGSQSSQSSQFQYQSHSQSQSDGGSSSSSSSTGGSQGVTWAWTGGAADGGWGRSPPGGSRRTALVCPLCGRRTCRLCGGKSHFGPGPCRGAGGGGGDDRRVIGREENEIRTGGSIDIKSTPAKRAQRRAGLRTKRRRMVRQVDRGEASFSQDLEVMVEG
ncbi:hypothetical protein VTH82DRAFT_2639 [Thermothelomyces myriococcoides]